jgi:hypothetical protein
MKCPKCGKEMIIKTAERYFNKDGSNKKFYACVGYPKCRTTISSHPYNKPVGEIAEDKEASILRKKLHKLMNSKFNTKPEMYKWLQHNIGINHVSLLKKEQLKDAIRRMETMNNKSNNIFNIFKQIEMENK